jgi:predicted ATPase
MKLKLQNVGIISNCDINIDGITIITGQNDSGKSTVGKVLYAIVRALNNDDKYFNESKLNFLQKKLDEILNLIIRINNANDNDSKIIDDLIKENISILTRRESNTEKIINSVNNIEKSIGKHSNEDIVKNILKIIDEIREREKIKINSFDFLNFELTEYFNLEFGNQISNNFLDQETSIEIETNIGSTTFIAKENKIFLEKQTLNFPYNDVIFIESPLFLDKGNKSYNFNSLRSKRNYLNNKLNQLPESKDIFSDNSNDMNLFNKMIQDVIGGDFIYNKNNEIVFHKNGKEFSLNNVATGLKTFGALQLLIANNNLDNDTLLIIDEPEVHLHPTWQVKYAEILVKLSKEFAIPMVLTSHSPYFIEAIEAFSIKHNFQNSVDFYFAQKYKEGLNSKIIDITNDLVTVLDSISEAYYNLQSIRDEL